MKTIKLLMCAFIALSLGASCAKEEEEEPQPFLTLSDTKDIICSPAEGDSYILLSSSHPWTVRSDNDWCEVSHANKNNQKGDDILVLFHLSENTGLSERTTTVTVASTAGNTVKVTVKQKGQDDNFIIVSKDTVTFSPQGGESVLILSASHKWTVSCDSAWCAVSHSDGENPKGNHLAVVLTADEHTELTERKTKVTITSETGETVEVAVVQKGQTDNFVIVSKDTVNFSPQGGESVLILSASHKWTVSCDSAWCHVSHSEGENPKGNNLAVLLTVDENPGFTARAAKVIILSETGETAEVAVRQAGKEDVAPRLVSFIFKASDNPSLLVADAVCTIDGNTVSVLIPHVMLGKKLVPEFTFEGKQVLVGSNIQESGKDSVDFSLPVEYIVQNQTGESRTYTVQIASFTGLPIVFINTKDNAPIVSKDDYVDATIRIIEDVSSAGNVFSSEVKIKGRGNSTWSMPKKPYKMKFDKKTSLLGEPKDKEWVLLANYTDKTNLRNETAFFMGRLSLLEWTPRTHFVEVFLNEVYNGTYQLCEQIKIAEDRVNVTDDGYLMEVDQLDRLEPGDVYFQTFYHFFNIKEPDVELNSDRYNWIKDYVTNVENLLSNENFDAATGYAQYVDIPSFVDWYLINEITKNNDAIMFSSCYLNIAPNGKLKMGPLWDFDIGLGNVNYNTNEIPTGFWIKSASWFQQLFKDPVFVEQMKTRFAYFKSKKDEIFNNINSNAASLKWSVIENNNRWHTLYTYTWPNYAIWGAYDNEVQYMKNWLDTRFEWLEQAYKDL